MTNIDWRKWFDKMQPQTLQIATMLIYINGVFSALSVLDTSGYLGYLRLRFWFGLPLALVVVAIHGLSGVMMANDKKIGYKFGLAAAFSPFIIRYWAFSDMASSSGMVIGIYDKFTGGSAVNLLFEVALCALLLHPQSRSHQRIWYK